MTSETNYLKSKPLMKTLNKAPETSYLVYDIMCATGISETGGGEIMKL